MRGEVKKAVATSLIITSVACQSTTAKADAVAVLEATKGTPIGVYVTVGSLIVTGVTTVIGIKHKEDNLIVYQSLEYLPGKWKPNSIVERVKPNGKVIQRRWYGKDGRASFDIDLTDHGAPSYHPSSHGGAHKHKFDYSQKIARQKAEPLTNEEYEEYVKNFDSNKAERINVKRIGVRK